MKPDNLVDRIVRHALQTRTPRIFFLTSLHLSPILVEHSGAGVGLTVLCYLDRNVDSRRCDRNGITVAELAKERLQSLGQPADAYFLPVAPNRRDYGTMFADVDDWTDDEDYNVRSSPAAATATR